jgi:hypothetical protein
LSAVRRVGQDAPTPPGEERQAKWDEFYGSDLWKTELGPRANPLMKDSSNVIAVQPTPGSAIQ